MRGKPNKIELIGDGEGNVIAFINDKPMGPFYTEWRLPDELKHKIEKLLCRYWEEPEPDEEVK